MDLDTLHLTDNAKGNLVDAPERGHGGKKLLVFHDRHTKDIEAYSVPTRDAKHVADSMIQFGGNGPASHGPPIRSLVADDAKEFVSACSSIHSAHFKGTPGRDTSHGVAERANRTALEWGRPALKQSGLGLAFGGHAIRMGLLNRRLITSNGDGVSIHSQKHGPDVPVPPMWGFGAAITFSPTLRQKAQPKVAPRGREGLLIGYAMQPGGAWSGDFLCVSQRL